MPHLNKTFVDIIIHYAVWVEDRGWTDHYLMLYQWVSVFYCHIFTKQNVKKLYKTETQSENYKIIKLLLKQFKMPLKIIIFGILLLHICNARKHHLEIRVSATLWFFQIPRFCVSIFFTVISYLYKLDLDLSQNPDIKQST